MDVFIGFDSAWADNPRAPGAICAVGLEGDQPVLFRAPEPVGFEAALRFVRELRSPDGVTLLAIDQPTLVPNATGMRPAERVAASLISWLGGGVQPANRGRRGIFCDDAPVWRFLAALGATEDPEAARVADRGLFIMEVFPALALAALDPGFFARLGGPRYNPARRKTFLAADWRRVAATAAEVARGFGCDAPAEWCLAAASLQSPRKADQDALDAVLCALVALRWRRGHREGSLLLGDLSRGYIVAPASRDVRLRLAAAAGRHGVPLDGTIPSVSAPVPPGDASSGGVRNASLGTRKGKPSTPRLIVVSLPVVDLAKSVAFYEAIGARRIATFSDADAACMVFSDTMRVMLVTRERYARFTTKRVADPRCENAMMICITAESRAAVDDIVDAAALSGTLDPCPKQDHGGMYGRSFEDPDGHVWEVMWMDAAAATAG